MKTNFITFCAAALSLVALSSCNKADVDIPVTKLTAKVAETDGSRTYYNPKTGLTEWSSKDIIYVLDESGNIYGSEQLATSGAEVEFSFQEFPAEPTYAVFVGHDNDESLGIENSLVTANLLTEQRIANGGSFGKNASLAIGEVIPAGEAAYGATMKNVCGLLKLTLPEGIQNVKITGNSSESLSGVVYIDYNGGEPKWTVKEGVDHVNIIPYYKNEIYQAGVCYACVLPQTFESGITVTLTDIYGNTAETKGSNPLVLERNKVVELPNLNIPEADGSVTLTFDFSNAGNFPSGFPSISAATVEGNQAFIAENGNSYIYTFGGKVRRVSSCLALIDKQTMTFPVIEGKGLTSVTITGGNAGEKNWYLTDADGTKISGTGKASTAGPVTLSPNEGTTATSLYNSSSSLYISKLELVYE